jgi:hypothetical protein
MSAQLFAIVSEFDAQKQADSYDRLFRDKVKALLDAPSPTAYS